MSWRITPSYDGLVSDADATAYLAAVQAADGQLLEPAVRIAVNNFIVGCKSDGIWTAIKASCILAGARTVAGALVPLVGPAPTNFNFASGDYNRKTGLVGNGSTKYLNSNRNNNADPQNNKHISIYVTTLLPENAYVFDGGATTAGRSQLVSNTAGGINFAVNSNTRTVGSASSVSGFVGAVRQNPSEQALRANGILQTAAVASVAPFNVNFRLFSGTDNTSYSASRLAFYSIGESLDLALLDARVTTLINAFDAAI
jgi:hypothetical protein